MVTTAQTATPIPRHVNPVRILRFHKFRRIIVTNHIEQNYIACAGTVKLGKIGNIYGFGGQPASGQGAKSTAGAWLRQLAHRTRSCVPFLLPVTRRGLLHELPESLF